jgi:hypothetical protein
MDGGYNSVIFVYPDTGGTKPTGTFAAMYTDWTAMGIPMGLATNGQYETLDTIIGSPIFMNTGTGQPGVSGMTIVLVGGVLVNSVIHYLEVSTQYGGAAIFFNGSKGRRANLLDRIISTGIFRNSSDKLVLTYYYF